ncbi:MAG: hypothetical protein KIH69_000750 [Anaerolineae bacterium]|nr:hypothetical protein [Anaerolineae bacterium]
MANPYRRRLDGPITQSKRFILAHRQREPSGRRRYGRYYRSAVVPTARHPINAFHPRTSAYRCYQETAAKMAALRVRRYECGETRYRSQNRQTRRKNFAPCAFAR